MQELDQKGQLVQQSIVLAFLFVEGWKDATFVHYKKTNLKRTLSKFAV